MRDIDKSIVQELCEGHPLAIQKVIKVAYWYGCNDGLAAAKSKKNKVLRRKDNVVYLKNP